VRNLPLMTIFCCTRAVPAFEPGAQKAPFQFTIWLAPRH
jgi:hypothetical protein